MTLLSEILEQLYFESLIEEGKDPIELLHYKFRYVPTEILDSIIAIDPTKKKSYSQWVLSKWNEESDTIVSGLKSGRLEKLFQHYKNHQDIQIKDCPSVEEGLRAFVPEEDTVLVKSSNPTTVLMNSDWKKEVPSELANDFDVVFNEDNWVIAVPNTYEADCKLGENMFWCTAGGRSSFENGRGYFDRYLSDYGGKYFVNFDMSQGESRNGKDYPFTRYQFHFESHQFMDKNDDPVEISDIGMPDSAMQYYLDEGYSEDDFVDEEGRRERYDQNWYGCSFRINDDLHLNISYDNENFHFEQPNENTDYYLFNYNDDNDPISWIEIPNPNADRNAVILNSYDMCIFKRKYADEDGAVVAIRSTFSGWDRWEAYTFGKYMVLPNNVGVFGVGEDETYTFISNNADESTKIQGKECESIFINEYCTKYDAENWGMVFVETVTNGYHSLFAISIDNNMGDECEVIVPRDIPVNGEYFAINEKGLVEGEFRTYRVYDDNYYGGADSGPQWTLEEKFPNGDYMISVDDYGRGKKVFNILKPKSKEPLIKDWFDKYKGASLNLYGLEKNKKIGFFAISNGQQVGRWYDDFSGIDQQNDIIGGIIGRKETPNETDIINGNIGKVISSFKFVISRKAINNKIIVQDFDGYTSKVYDYIEGKFYFPQLSMFRRVDQYDHPYIFACDMKGTEENALFDLKKLQILVRGIKAFNKLSRYNNNYIKLTKLNNKVNVFDMTNLSEMFQNDVDEITGLNEYTNMIVYVLGNKFYPFNYKTKQVQINPNGIGVPTYVSDSSDKVYCQSKNYSIYFAPENNLKSYKFYKWQNNSNYGDYGTNFDREHTPQEVLNMYNLIFGQQEAITKDFKQFVNRINEAMKLSHVDNVD